jgi:protein-S-isoprenylcysteine O-methyltransferase Ste14
LSIKVTSTSSPSASESIVAMLGAYFYYCASVEEKNLTAIFPTTYPAYGASTKMLIPYVL